MASSNSILPDDLVTAVWLDRQLAEPTLQVIDILGYVHTENLGGGRQTATYTGALEEYLAGHIPGAAFIDWTSDIVDPDAEAKAQIANPEQFAVALGEAGVDGETDVVVVDHTGGHFATRLWWALRLYGHDRVAIVDGGFKRWQALGLRTESGRHTPVAKTFVARPRPKLLSNADDIATLIESGARQIVDARDAGAFSGAVQRGSRGGHIPTALNLPIATLFDDDGLWKDAEELRVAALAAGVDVAEPVTAYCNGGVTATAVLFGLHRAGLDDLSNYDGSWNEWGERFELPVEDNRDLWREDAP